MTNLLILTNVNLISCSIVVTLTVDNVSVNLIHTVQPLLNVTSKAIWLKAIIRKIEHVLFISTSNVTVKFDADCVKSCDQTRQPGPLEDHIGNKCTFVCFNVFILGSIIYMLILYLHLHLNYV